MMDSVIIAAPLLIAALVMAFGFVGCGLDTMGAGGRVLQRYGVGQRRDWWAFGS